jgi:hypothetical protein
MTFDWPLSEDWTRALEALALGLMAAAVVLLTRKDK